MTEPGEPDTCENKHSTPDLASPRGREGVQAEASGLRRCCLLVGLSMVVPTVLLLAYFGDAWTVPRGRLFDPDAYLRLVRVRQLHDTRQWYNGTIARADAPYGETFWTRPVDVLLLAGATLLTLATDFETALFWWGVTLSPFLLGLTFLALLWASRPLLDKPGPYLAALLFTTSLPVLSYYSVARPDHHSLLLLLLVVFLGFNLRQIERPFDARICLGSGAIGALSFWVSVESQVILAIAVATLGVLWVLRDEDFLLKNLYSSVTLFLLACVALFLERAPSDWFTVQFDRFSIVHCAVAGLASLFWITVFVLHCSGMRFERRARRLWAMAIGVPLLVGIAWLLSPSFFRGPLATLDPRMVGLLLEYAPEWRPLFSTKQAATVGVPFAGMTLLSLPFLVVWSVRGTRRAGWAHVTALTAIFVFLAFSKLRWVPHAQILLTLPIAQLLARVWLSLDGRARVFERIVAKGAILTIVLLASPVWGLQAGAALSPMNSQSSAVSNPLPPMALWGYLQNSDRWAGRELRIVTHVRYCGELLYRTRHGVVGVLGARGELDTYDILTAQRDEDALGLIRKRGVDTILLCPDSEEGRFYLNAHRGSTFYGRLCEGHLPPWCREVPLPKELAGSFKLFAVAGQ